MPGAIDFLSHTARSQGHLEQTLDEIAADGMVVRSADHAHQILTVAENLAKRLAHFRQGRLDVGGLAVHSKALDEAHQMMREFERKRDLSQIAHPLVSHGAYHSAAREAYERAMKIDMK